MKRVGPGLHLELRKTATSIAVAWKLTRKDGLVIGFTSSDIEFTYEGVTYTPTNAFSGTAAVAKNNFSVDNVNAVALTGPEITKASLIGGLWDNAAVEVFWIKADQPALGIVPIRGGTLGEIKVGDTSFETELRSVMQQLQQDFGDVYTLDCRASLGDNACKVELDPPVWARGTVYFAKIAGEAGIGDIVKPTVANGFWYEVVGAPNTILSNATTGNAAARAKLARVKQKNGMA